MSYDLVDATFSIILPPIEKVVLLALCKHAHDDGTSSYPSIKLLTAETGYKERGIQNALRSLEAKNIIVAVSSKVGGRHSQTVHYRILQPGPEAIEAAKHPWKGEPPAPDYEGPDGNGRTTCTRTGAPHAPDTTLTGAGRALTGAGHAPTGAPRAPKSVSEEVKEQVNKTTTTTEAEAGEAGTDLSPKGAGTPKADGIIAWFIQNEGKAMPANKKLKQEIEAMLANVPDAIGNEAVKRWHSDRDFEGLRFPAQKLLEELPTYIKLVTSEQRKR